MKLLNILESESTHIYSVKVILRVKSKYNISDIYNEIRGLKNVIILRPDSHKIIGPIQRAIVTIKFIASIDPKSIIQNIITSAKSINGIITFKVLDNTLEKVNS